MNNQFKDLTEHQLIIAIAVYVNKNIRQQELSMVLKRYNIYGGTRKVRELVNQIRKKGYQSWQNKQWFLIADNDGYSWEQCDSSRAKNWINRITSQKAELTKLQESYLNINYNEKQILLGNLGTDVEMKELDNGTKIATFSLATNEKTKGGQKITTWHNCLCFNRQAELAADFLSKGSKCLIEGRLQYRDYETKNGEQKRRYETIISSLTFIDPAKNQNKPKNDYESKDDEPF